MSEQEIIDNWLNMRQQQPVQLATQDAYWQQVRIQAAIAAMQGQLANQILTENMIESVVDVANFPKVVANTSVRIADALVAELKKGGQDERD